MQVVHSVSLLQCTLSPTAAMAGITALTDGLHSGQWFRCSDGSLMEPLDYLHLMFPNHGRNVIGENVCFVPRPFSMPLVSELLPEEDEFFVPSQLVDGVVTLALCTVVVTIVMIVVKWVWSQVDPRFAAISPAHKQWYVVANMCKATALAVLTLSTRFWIGTYMAIHLDNYASVPVKRCAMVYIATDLAALYMVPKLPLSTIMHHVATTALSIVDLGINLELKGWSGLLGVAKMSLLYGIYSTPNFAVNAYLGLRVVYPKAKWQGSLITFSLCVYVLCCAMNWSTHAVWLAGLVWNWDMTVYNVLYLLPISAMIHDDVVLIQWLLRKSSPLAEEKREVAGNSQEDSH